jgi:hypothetical protein
MMEAARTSETLVNFYQTTRCYNPEDSYLHTHRRENLKSYFLSGLSTGLKEPTGKGRRFIIAHIGSNSGFVDSGLLIFKSKSSREYHEEMTGEVFLKWSQSILP